jgi:hypothetical protein
MAWYAKFDGVDGASESRGAPSVSEIVVTKQNDSAHETPFYLHLESIDGEATASGRDLNDIYIFKSPDSPSASLGGSGDDILIGGTTGYDQASSASPVGTGDLADWQGNYGSGGIAAADYKMHRIGYTAAGSTAADGDTRQGMNALVDGGVDLLLGDGSVRGLSPRDAAFLAYDPGFLGGVTVAAGDSIDPLDALIFAGDRYDHPHEQGIGGISIAVGDIDAKGPHMLMTAGFLF